jgi:hypothetical protein
MNAGDGVLQPRDYELARGIMTQPIAGTAANDRIDSLDAASRMQARAAHLPQPSHACY